MRKKINVKNNEGQDAFMGSGAVIGVFSNESDAKAYVNAFMKTRKQGIYIREDIDEYGEQKFIIVREVRA